MYIRDEVGRLACFKYFGRHVLFKSRTSENLSSHFSLGVQTLNYYLTKSRTTNGVMRVLCYKDYSFIVTCLVLPTLSPCLLTTPSCSFYYQFICRHDFPTERRLKPSTSLQVFIDTTVIGFSTFCVYHVKNNFRSWSLDVI